MITLEIIFSKTLKKSGTKKNEGKVMIAEAEGTWIAGWSKKQSSQFEETWYKGLSWEDMLSAYRKHISEKLEQGYVPILYAASNNEL